jgi:arylsulfatase
MEAHAPYAPHRPFAGRFSGGGNPEDTSAANPNDPVERQQYVEALYDEEILELDTYLHHLVQELEDRGLSRDSWLIITSDHGEAFGEHGRFEHGSTVYGMVTRIPLIVKAPNGMSLPAHRSAVSLLDLATTIAWVATDEPLGEGRDLRLSELDERPVQIELFRNARKTRVHGPRYGEPERAVIAGTMKLIEGNRRDRELYDLEADIWEMRDLSKVEKDEVDALAEWLPPLREVESRREERALSASDAEQLRALGYLR